MRMWIPFTLSVAVLIAGLWLYFDTFNGALSCNSSQWSDFGQYFSLFVSVASLIFIGFVSVVANRAQEEAQRSNALFQQRQLMPVLDLTTKRHREDYYPVYKDCWNLLNCASAAARNISLRFHTVDGEVFLISMFALQQNAVAELPWLRKASRVELYFTDAFDENFYLVVVENRRSVFSILSREQYQAVRNQVHISVSDVELNFNEKFIEIGAEFTNDQYLALFRNLSATAV